ncbi:hypothetical protein T459_28067 [Capsicum annuum]|uniref:Uncharacterized protein n=1 Tax=Capsicum annuum TaxID=4072 RepID=A0A1U8EIL6_CAPAN|nr:hypothetical protein T459_28067 [Capsicum annuum]
MISLADGSERPDSLFLFSMAPSVDKGGRVQRRTRHAESRCRAIKSNLRKIGRTGRRARNSYKVSACCYWNKAVLLKSRDLTVEQGLDYVATWNSGALLSDDLKEAISAHSQKRKPEFAKL